MARLQRQIDKTNYEILRLRLRMTAPPHPCPLPRGKGGKRHEMTRLRKTGEIKTLDSLLDWIHSLIGSPIRSGTNVENDRKGKADSSLRSE